MTDPISTDKQLEARFDNGTLFHPLDNRHAGSMDLFRAVASLCGVQNSESSDSVDQLRQEIGQADHYLFVIIDGLGMNQEGFFAPSGFFDTYFAKELRAFFPSTTSTVLTSLVTLQWPSQHAIVGWFTHLPDQGYTSIPLLFQRRKDETPLEKLGIKPDQVFPSPNLLSQFGRTCHSFTNKEYIDTSFGRWSRAETRATGFSNLEDAFDKLTYHLNRTPASSYTYLYLAEIDHLSHKHGWNDQSVHEAMFCIDRQLLGLKANLNRDVRIIVTSDHGHINVPKERQIFLTDADTLIETLEVPPSGDLRFPLFHVRPGKESEFLRTFESTLSENFTLISKSTAEQLRLLGPDPLSPLAKSRLGDYIGIALSPAVVLHTPPNREPIDYLGFHSGLSADEMRVPLFIA